MSCCSPRGRETPAAPAGGEETGGGAGWRRTRSFAEWAAPIAALALMPKCPMCVAGYVALLTGVGLSISAASAVRWAFIGLSVLALAFLSLRAALRMRSRLAG